MKIKDGFMLRQVAGQWLVVPLGERVVEFNGMITLSESGAIIWQEIVAGSTVDKIITRLVSEYDVNEEMVRSDVDEFIGVMDAKGLLV